MSTEPPKGWRCDGHQTARGLVIGFGSAICALLTLLGVIWTLTHGALAKADEAAATAIVANAARIGALETRLAATEVLLTRQQVLLDKIDAKTDQILLLRAPRP